MMGKHSLQLLNVGELRPHEQTRKRHLAELLKTIQKKGYLAPILVDAKTRIILDGHHRHASAVQLGLRLIPAYLVDYLSGDVKLGSWRPAVQPSKEEVIARGLAGKPYPAKTTRHRISGLRKHHVPLELLA